jgi:hypothetical protein
MRKSTILLLLMTVAATADDFRAPITGYAGLRAITGIPGGAIAEAPAADSILSAVQASAPHAAIWFDGTAYSVSAGLARGQKPRVIEGGLANASNLAISPDGQSALVYAASSGRVQRIMGLNGAEPRLTAAVPAPLGELRALGLVADGGSAYALNLEGALLRVQFTGDGARVFPVLTVGPDARMHARGSGVTVFDVAAGRLWLIQGGEAAPSPLEFAAGSTDVFEAAPGIWAACAEDRIEIRTATGEPMRELQLPGGCGKVSRASQTVWIVREGGAGVPLYLLDLTDAQQPNLFFVPVK